MFRDMPRCRRKRGECSDIQAALRLGHWKESLQVFPPWCPQPLLARREEARSCILHSTRQRGHLSLELRGNLTYLSAIGCGWGGSFHSSGFEQISVARIRSAKPQCSKRLACVRSTPLRDGRAQEVLWGFRPPVSSKDLPHFEHWMICDARRISSLG